MAPTLLDSALGLARRGLQVLPGRPRGKQPATRHGFLDATTDTNIIRAWWAYCPDYNVAIATGAKSGVMVLDIDADKGGEATLRQLEEQHAELPQTVESITGGGGRHLFFKWPAGHDIRSTVSRIGDGLDIRGNGGCAVAAPSLHESGRRYAWSVDSASAFAECPEWLLAKITAPKAAPQSDGKPATAWADLVRDGVNNGCRNDTLTRLVGFWLQRGFTASEALEHALMFNESRCRPPKEPDEVETIVDSISAAELRKRTA
jgi:hypothetical protein